MLWKIQLGIGVAVIAALGFLFWQNDNLRDDVATLELQKSILTANLNTQKNLAAANAEALRFQQANARRLAVEAQEANKIREAILKGNGDETIDAIGGPVGAAIRLLGQRRGDCQRTSGDAGHPALVDQALPVTGAPH